MARDIGFHVWACDPYVPRSQIVKKAARSVSLKTLARGSDFISLHMPLTAETHHIINEKILKEMKAGSYLINTARGELVHEEALFVALKEGWIAGAGLDVMEKEPWPPDSPLRELDNLIVTPHCAWYTERSEKELRRKACAEVIRVLGGKAPQNLVNREVIR
jgi:D-3-phosphoglycerate dehydrogenase